MVSVRRLSSVLEKDDLWVRWLIWHTLGDEVLWLHVGCGLLLIIGFFGMFMLPFKMFNNCWKAVIIFFACICTHCPNNGLCLSKWEVSLPAIGEILGRVCHFV